MSNKMAPDLGKLDELAKVHALSYASPHHFTMSVNGLREVIAELQLPAGNKMALDALTAAKTQLEILLPDYGRVHDETEALAKIDAAIAALQAEPQPAIPKGWVFSSADFSLQASGASDSGSVMLVRGGMARVGWHQLTEAQKESIPLYVSGTGKTIAQAIANAVKNCTPLRLPATPPKD